MMAQTSVTEAEPKDMKVAKETWVSFTKAMTGTVIFVVVVLVLMLVFLV